MSDNGNGNGTNPADIITYIGVPLAVLGVAPILYNTAATLATLSRVRQTLRKSKLAGITRGDVINHVIETELPRFSIAPLDREEHSDEYWSVYEHPSQIPGGSWTVFNWKTQTIGLKTQRIEYVDQLRQPQAEVNFEDLVSYLLDLGAVPSAIGFRTLRTTGLWIPTGTPLLLSPDRSEVALTIAPLDDSDGHLSLAVRWSRKWAMRNRISMPPYWIRITAPMDGKLGKTVEEVEEVTGENDTKRKEWNPIEPDPAATVMSSSDVDTAISPKLVEIENTTETEQKPSFEEPTSDTKDVKDITAPEETEKVKTPKHIKLSSIRCHISIDGLADAIREDSNYTPIEHIGITHLEIRKTHNNSTAGIWFASAATAVGASGDTVLWNYHIPEDVLNFSRRETIPCGILVLMDIVEESATPEWATSFKEDEHELMQRRFRKMREESEAMRREQRMSPEERSEAARQRQMKHHEDWMEEIRTRQRLQIQQEEQRTVEALQSAKWDTKLVAGHNLTWLKRKLLIDAEYEIKKSVEGLLYRMLVDYEFAYSLTQVLDSWRGFVDGGGMRKADLELLRQKQELFAYASLILAVIRDSSTAVDGSLAMDLQESVRIWKNVRLG